MAFPEEAQQKSRLGGGKADKPNTNSRAAEADQPDFMLVSRRLWMDGQDTPSSTQLVCAPRLGCHDSRTRFRLNSSYSWSETVCTIASSFQSSKRQILTQGQCPDIFTAQSRTPGVCGSHQVQPLCVPLVASCGIHDSQCVPHMNTCARSYPEKLVLGTYSMSMAWTYRGGKEESRETGCAELSFIRLGKRMREEPIA